MTNSVSGEPEREIEAAPALIGALQALTRVLVAVALRSVETPSRGAVSLPQFRVLLVIDDLGPTRPGMIARAVGIDPSTVTRLVDRLVASGHLSRARDPGHRGAVALALTELGREVVSQVLSWRKQELSRIAARLTRPEQETTAQALRQLAEAAGPDYGAMGAGLRLLLAA
jgi:DNA-binding MarR family transcriptional regulator